MPRHIQASLLSLFLWLLALPLAAAPLPELPIIQQQAKLFYETKGEWAGKFVVQSFLRHRIEPVNDTQFNAHLEYQWAFAQASTHSGTDERVFRFRWQDGQWQVVEMGGNHSGKL